MAWSYDVNNVGGVNGGAEVMYDFKELLKANGWSVRASGGGTGSGLFSAVGDIIVDPGGVGKMDVPGAWFIVQANAGMAPQREFMVQRGATNVDWRVSVSAEDGYTGGAAGEDTPYTASDEEFLIGTAGPAYEIMFPVASSYRYHMGADSTDPWGFYFFCVLNGGSPARSYGIFDPLAPTSFDSLDQDPAVYTWGTEVNRLDESNINGSRCRGWYKKDLAGEAFVVLYGMGYGGSFDAAIPGAVGTNPYDDDHNYFPIPYARITTLANHGWKGFGTVLQWIGSPRTDMDTLSSAGVKDRICVGPDCVLPWPDTTPVV